MAPTAPTSTAADQDTWEAKIARLRARQPRERTVTLPDEEAAARTVEARIGVSAARTAVRRRLDESGDPLTDEALEADPDYQAAVTAWREAQAEEERLSVKWRLRALPPDIYDTFTLDHPPTAEQKERGQAYNQSTYNPAIIAACSVEEISTDQVAELISTAALNQGDLALLVAGCLDVNQKSAGSLGKG